MKTPGIIIAIDGHSSTGKSTFAKAIASRYSMIYVDTGALYRSVTLCAIRGNAINEDNSVNKELLAKLLSDLVIEFRTTGEGGRTELYMNGKNIESEIRGMEVSSKVSVIATLGFVREYVNRILKRYGEKKGVVMDGRDIGTAVFPEAELKIFMTAGVEVRARRRYDEMISKGVEADFDVVLKNVVERDYIDEHRENSPLRMADDALLLDNSQMSVEQQIEWVDNIIERRWS